MKSGPNSLESPISGSEWRFVLIVGCVALLVASVPYCLGALLATRERIFGGFVYATEDCYAYLAHMNEGAHGDWLFTLPYTPETHSAQLFYLFHLLLGHLAALLPFGDLTARIVWVYHAARWIFGLSLLLTVYRFIAEFIARVAVRRLAWLMIIFGGGLGWLLVALGQSNWLGSPPLDFILPEGFTFLVLYAFPHIALARTLLLWGILFLLRAWLPNEDERDRQHVSLTYSRLAGAVWLLMGLVVPFYIVVAWAVTGAAWVVLSIRHRRAMWHQAGQATIAVLVSCPVVLYSAWVFATDPVYAVWSAQNQITSPHPLHYVAAYGLPLVLAALALRDAWREERPMWLAAAWVGVVPFLAYLPFNLQRRLVEGVQIPLSILAAWGLWQIANRQPQIPNRKSQITNRKPGLMMAVVIILLSLTNVLLVAGNCLALRGQPAPIYRDAGEIAALGWLHGQTEATDVVLSSYETGNYLPVRVWARAFVGHGPETVHSDEKRALVNRFFDVLTDDGWRYELLAYYGVDYIFWGPAERRLGDYDPRLSPYYLWPIYDKDGYLIFRVAQ